MADEINRAKDLFEWNRRFFAILGVWPLQSTYVKFTLWTVYLMIHMSMVYADLIHVFGNLELMVRNLSESALETMIIIKFVVMRFSGTLVRVMKRIIDDIDERLFESNEEVKIYLSYNNIAKRFFKVWLTMGIVTTVSYNLKPLEFRLKSALRNESTPFVLAHRTRLFFEINDSSTFWLVWMYQLPIMFMSAFHTATIGYLFTLVLHVCGQLAVLTFRIRNLDLSHRETIESSRNIFRDILESHYNILDLAEGINDVFGLLLLEELLFSTLLIGLTCYGVLDNVHSEETGLFITFLLYGFTMLLLIYGYCVAGEYLITESANLCEAYYECQWYNGSAFFKKQLIICMICSSRPIQLSAGGFYIFSLESFTSILKSSAGYISMLRTMI